MKIFTVRMTKTITVPITAISEDVALEMAAEDGFNDVDEMLFGVDLSYEVIGEKQE